MTGMMSKEQEKEEAKKGRNGEWWKWSGDAAHFNRPEDQKTRRLEDQKT